MNAMELIARKKSERSANGLRLEFVIPGRDTTFIRYVRDEEQKERILKMAADDGWTRVA